MEFDVVVGIRLVYFIHVELVKRSLEDTDEGRES